MPGIRFSETVITRFHYSVPITRKQLCKIATEYLSHTNGSPKSLVNKMCVENYYSQSTFIMTHWTESVVTKHRGRRVVDLGYRRSLSLVYFMDIREYPSVCSIGRKNVADGKAGYPKISQFRVWRFPK